MYAVLKSFGLHGPGRLRGGGGSRCVGRDGRLFHRRPAGFGGAGECRPGPGGSPQPAVPLAFGTGDRQPGPRRRPQNGGRSTTCPCCWRCWPLRDRSTRPSLTPPSWGRLPWTAPCGRWRGVLPMALAAAEKGIRSLYLPAANAAEAAEACGGSGMQVYGAGTVYDVIHALDGRGASGPHPAPALPARPELGGLPRLCRRAGPDGGTAGHGGGGQRAATTSC